MCTAKSKFTVNKAYYCESKKNATTKQNQTYNIYDFHLPCHKFKAFTFLSECPF